MFALEKKDVGIGNLFHLQARKCEVANLNYLLLGWKID